MTVDELIRMLRKHPPDLRVMVQGYEEGYDDLEADCVGLKEVRLNINTKWYYGRHEQAFQDDKKDHHETVRALVMHRPWHDDGE